MARELRVYNKTLAEFQNVHKLESAIRRLVGVSNILLWGLKGQSQFHNTTDISHQILCCHVLLEKRVEFHLQMSSKQQ